MAFVEDDDIAQDSGEDEYNGKKFVDREIQRNAFDLYLSPMNRAGIGNDGVLWIYSGVGGIGKTVLFDEFEKLAGKYGKKFVRHDFMDNGTNMVGTLKALRKKLSENYQMEFPLFDKGCIYLARKSGEFVSAEQQKAVLESSSLFRSFKKNVSKAFSVQDKSSTAIKAAKSVIDDDIFAEGLQTLGEGVQNVVEGITEITPDIKLAKGLLELLDKKIAEHEQNKRFKSANKKGNTSYGKAAAELEKRNAEDEPAYIREFLPTLFAQDLSFWLDENNSDLIVFLDTYEVLIGEERGDKKTVRLLSENRDVPVDWWVGKLLAAERVMWVIAGRYELNKIGRVKLTGNNGVKNFTVDVFDEKWSNEYLKLVGVKEENLRRELFKLTGGHPFYLHACSITYDNNISNGRLPSIKDFGENKDKIIERAIGSLDENGQLMTQCLCILNRWTDEIAVAVIENLNNVTYKRVSNLFARADSQSLDDETVYTFDRTIDAFFFPSLKVDVTCRNLFVKIRDASNAYFKKFFAEYEKYDSKPEFYFGMWSDIILRTTDAPDELMTLYDENLAPIEKYFDLSMRANCAEKFFDKVGDNETLPSAYFQSRLSKIRDWQGRSKDALELAEAAYNKVKKISLRDEERQIKIWVMMQLAYVFENLDRYTDEIPLRKEIVMECERCFSDKRDERTINAKKEMANALECGDRSREAFEIRKQIFELFDEHDGERYIDAAKDFKNTLDENGDFESTLPLRRKIVAFYENAQDVNSLFCALYDLIDTLKIFSDEKHLEEKVACYRRYFELCEEFELKISPDDLEDFVGTLKELGCDDEATQILQSQDDNSTRRIEDLKRRIESVGTPDVETVNLINALLELLEDFDDSQVEHWKNKLNEAVQIIIDRTCREPIDDYDAAISTLECLNVVLCDDGVRIKLGQAILSLTEKKPDAEESEIIEAKEELLVWLRTNEEENREEVNRLFEEIEDYYRKNLPESLSELVKTLSYHAGFFSNIDDYSAAVEKYKEAIDLLEKDSEPDVIKILRIMQDISRVFARAENYSDELHWLEHILEFCREHFTEDDFTTRCALHALIRFYVKLEDYEKAEQYSRELIAIEEKNLGSSHNDVIEEKKKLADILQDAEKYDEARELLEEIIKLWRENFSANFMDKNYFSMEFTQAIEDLENLTLKIANEYDKANRHDEATSERIKALEQLNAILEETIDDCGASDDETKDFFDNIADVRDKISGDAQATEKFDELFGIYFAQDDDDDSEEISETEIDSPEETSETEIDLPEKISATEIDSSESLELRKGQRVPLAKNNFALDKLTVDFRWESNADLEIDASAFLLGTDEKAHADEDFIFYGNTESGGVKYLAGDGNASMQVTLKNISDDVAKISFALTIYDADNRNHNFSGVKIFARIVDETARKEIFHFDLTDNFTIETAVIIGEIYRHKGAWKFNAVGAGFSGGLKALCENFGLEVN